MAQTLKLKPVVATVALFDEMKSNGLITPLRPDVEAPYEGRMSTNFVKTVYAYDGAYGGHKLIHVSIHEHLLKQLTSHPENEDFLLFGPTGTVPMVLVVSKHSHDALVEKLEKNEVTADDFYCFYAPFNSPQLSLFTMHAGIPHAEVAADVVRTFEDAPQFFVTESKNLPENRILLESDLINWEVI